MDLVRSPFPARFEDSDGASPFDDERQTNKREHLEDDARRRGRERVQAITHDLSTASQAVSLAMVAVMALVRDRSTEFEQLERVQADIRAARAAHQDVEDLELELAGLVAGIEVVDEARDEIRACAVNVETALARFHLLFARDEPTEKKKTKR